jgi:hypothetical protein
MPAVGNQRMDLLVFFAAAVIVVLLIWLPFGFQLGGLIEEWGVLGLFTQHGVFLFAGPHSPLPTHRLRPFTVLPHALGFILNPDSFVWWHVLLMFSLVVKAFCASCMLWWTTRSRRWAILFGMLLVLYPADTMQLAFRSLHIDLSLSLILLASVFQILAFEAKAMLGKWSAAIMAALAALTAVWSYEAALLLMPLPMLLLFVREGWGGLWNRLKAQPWLGLPWVAAGVFCLAYIGYVWTHGGPLYQSDVIGPVGTIASRVNLTLVTQGFFRAVFGAWYDALRIFLREFQNYIYVVFAGGICIACAFGSRVFSQTSKTGKTKTSAWTTAFSLRMLLMALLLMVLGYAPYITSGSHLHISQRTFLFASLGGGFLWVAVLAQLDRFFRPAAWVAGSGLLVLGLGMQLYQFNHYVQISNTQKSLLRQIVENVPDLPGGKHLLIFDASEHLNHTWMLRDNITAALSYFYGKKVGEVMICLEPNGVWQKNDALARPGQCLQIPGGWVFRAAPPVGGPGVAPGKAVPDVVISQADAVALFISQDGTVASNEDAKRQRERLTKSSDVLSRRYRSVLLTKPWLNFPMFREQAVSAHYRWDFGKYWSMEVPPQGEGWREAEWEVGFLHHVSAAWKNLPCASLLFELAPLKQPYILQGRFTAFAPGANKNDFRFRLNGREVVGVWKDEHEFSAQVPADVPLTGLNTLEIISPLDNQYFGLCARLDWVRLDASLK